MTENRKHGWAFWTVVALVMVALYPLSVGPAYWLWIKAGEPRYVEDIMGVIYVPVTTLCNLIQDGGLFAALDLLIRYANWWIDLAKP